MKLQQGCGAGITCIRLPVHLKGLRLHTGGCESSITVASRLFACGDIAHLEHAPRPKAGVYAVRQAPVLYRNIISTLRGRQLVSYQPQKNFLALITCDGKYAIASKWGMALSGEGVWHWKQRIDRRFMRRLQE